MNFLLKGVKAGTAMLLLVGVIPLLYGFLLEVVVLMPVRVPLNQSPVYFIWQVKLCCIFLLTL